MPPEAQQLLDAIDNAIASLQAKGKPLPAGVDPAVITQVKAQHAAQAKSGAGAAPTPFNWQQFISTLMPILLALLGGL